MADTILVLSPHLDDAVLSAGGFMAARAAGGARVIAASVFSDGGDRPLYDRRRAEDARALAILGAERRWLGMLDAPYRPGGYRSFERLVLGEHETDAAATAEVAGAVRALLAELAPDRVLAPLAVGTHIDHRIVHAAARDTCDPDALRFYEDRPYCHVRYTVTARLWQLGWLASPAACPPDLRIRDADHAARALRESFFAAPHIRRFVPGRTGKERLLDAIERALRGAAAAPVPANGAAFERVAHGEEIARRVRDAINAYASQVPLLFGDEDAAWTAMRDYSRLLAPRAAHTERFWAPP